MASSAAFIEAAEADGDRARSIQPGYYQLRVPDVRGGGRGAAAGPGLPGRAAGDPRRGAARRHQRPGRHGGARRAEPDRAGHLSHRGRSATLRDGRRAAGGDERDRPGAAGRAVLGAGRRGQGRPAAPAGGPAGARPLRRAPRPAGGGRAARAAGDLGRPAGGQRSGGRGAEHRLQPVPGADHLLAGGEGSHHPGHGQGRAGDLQPARRRPPAGAGLDGQLPAGPAGAAHHGGRIGTRPGPYNSYLSRRAAADADRGARPGGDRRRAGARNRARGCTSCAARPTGPRASPRRSPSTTRTSRRPGRTGPSEPGRRHPAFSSVVRPGRPGCAARPARPAPRGRKSGRPSWRRRARPRSGAR